MIVTALLFLIALFGLTIPQEIFTFHNSFKQVITVKSSNAIQVSPEPTDENVKGISSRRPRKSPKPSINASPTSSPSSSSNPSPTATPKPTSSPSPSTSNTLTTNSAKDYIMSKINEYRASKGLSSVSTDSFTCDFAKVRAKEISTNFSHNGFSSRINSKSLPYPGYHEVTENIAMTSDYQQAVSGAESSAYKKVVTLWINSTGHAENMRRDTPFVCVENFGNYYAYEGWRP